MIQFHNGDTVLVTDNGTAMSGKYTLEAEFEGAKYFYLVPTSDDQIEGRVTAGWLERHAEVIKHK